jgi:hypothetical protein
MSRQLIKSLFGGLRIWMGDRLKQSRIRNGMIIEILTRKDDED